MLFGFVDIQRRGVYKMTYSIKRISAERKDIEKRYYASLDRAKPRKPEVTYIYKVDKRKNDVNGNPRNRITLYKIEKDGKLLLFADKEDIGYRGNDQAAFDIIQEKEGFKKEYESKNGFTFNEARLRQKEGRIAVHEM